MCDNIQCVSNTYLGKLQLDGVLVLDISIDYNDVSVTSGHTVEPFFVCGNLSFETVSME